MINNEKLPENFEVEKTVLATSINFELAKNKVLLSLTSDDFFTPKNKIIFETIYNLNSENKEVNFLNLNTKLKEQKKFGNGIDVIYLRELTESLVLPDKIDEYISILKETTTLRNLFNVFNTIETNYLNKNYKIESYNSFITEIQKSISSILEKRKILTFADSKQIVKETENYIKKISASEKMLTGFDTGFPELNKCTNGLQKQNLIVIAGRTGIGKTSLALNIALNIAFNDDIPIAIFSMEMSNVQLFIRLISIFSSVESKKILEGKLNEQKDQLGVYEALKKLETTKLFVDESSSLTILDLITKIKILKKEQPELGLIVVDYLGLISKEKNKKIESRYLEIQEYTRKLHELARELDLSIILLCQLNRKIDERTGGQPKLSDLRESGSIEQDAELVLLIFESSDNSSFEQPSDINKKIVNIKVAKNRNGISGNNIQLIFKKECSKFVSL